MANSKLNLFIVGITGSLGKALQEYYSKDECYNIYGSSSKMTNVSESIFYLDFLERSTLVNIPNYQIDHLIITSGYEPKFDLLKLSEEHLDKMFNIHVIGPLLLVRKMRFLFSENSSITFISSPAAFQGSYDPSYAAVKGSINSLVRTLAKELSPQIRVNALAPSLIMNSTVFDGMTDDFRERHIERTMNKRFLTLSECIEAIDFIIKSKHFTGQILHLNGGMVLG